MGIARRRATVPTGPVAALAVLLALQVAACAPAAGGLVSLDDQGNAVCAPMDDEGRAVFSISQVRNTSDEVLTVTAAALHDAEGATLIGLELRSPDEASASVVGLPYGEHGPAPFVGGIEIGPGQTRFVAVGLRSESGARAAAASVELAYRSSEATETATVSTRIAMQMMPLGAVCGSG